MNNLVLLIVAVVALQLSSLVVNSFVIHNNFFKKTIHSNAIKLNNNHDNRIDNGNNNIYSMWGNKNSETASNNENMSLLKEGINFPKNINGSDVRVGIIMARWNGDIISGLYKGVNESLAECGVKPSNIFTTYVPGAFELPVTARFLAASKRVDVIISIGCLIKGDTMHFEYIAEAVSQGLMKVSVDTMVPCIFGVLTVLNKEQAVKRSTGTTNEGLNWGTSAVEMGLARMSALGMDKAVSKQSESNPFVTFNGTLPNSGEGKNSTQPSKKIGF